MQCNLLPFHRQDGEFRNGFLWVLVRAIYVVASCDDVRQTVGAAVRHDKHLRAGFRR